MATNRRVGWVDAVRGIGILLVFYGHVLQNGESSGNPAALQQLRFIYAFHMPLFFAMSGFFFRPTADARARVKQLIVRRLVPVLFFGLLLLPLWARGELGPTASLGHDARELLGEYLRGRPELDWPTWFLVCLFVCETIAIFTLGRLRQSGAQLVFGVGCVFAGVWLCNHSITPSAGAAYVLGRTWFLSEAVVALGCYAIGHAAFPGLQRMTERRGLCVAALVGGVALLAFTYRLNSAAGEEVMMAARRQGDALRFLVAALAGTLAAVALGALLSEVGWLRAIGRDTLALLGLNGLFFHYINHHVAARWQFAHAWWAVTADATLVTAFSIVICLPAIRLLNRYLPQVVGKTRESGPLLPALE